MSFSLTLILPLGVASPRLAGPAICFGRQGRDWFPVWQLPDSPDPDRLKPFHGATEVRSVYQFGATKQLISFCGDVFGVWLFGEAASEDDAAICSNEILRRLGQALTDRMYETAWRLKYALTADDVMAFAQLITMYAELGAYILSDA